MPKPTALTPSTFSIIPPSLENYSDHCQIPVSHHHYLRLENYSFLLVLEEPANPNNF
ncbi:hypothetical protein LguiB_028766 [Lonicera macranthoides]